MTWHEKNIFSIKTAIMIDLLLAYKPTLKLIFISTACRGDKELRQVVVARFFLSVAPITRDSSEP